MNTKKWFITMAATLFFIIFFGIIFTGIYFNSVDKSELAIVLLLSTLYSSYIGILCCFAFSGKKSSETETREIHADDNVKGGSIIDKNKIQKELWIKQAKILCGLICMFMLSIFLVQFLNPALSLKVAKQIPLVSTILLIIDSIWFAYSLFKS